ncbi:phosphatase [Corynebacterium diphtheriae]|nr:phosphatase [Corynebacterium diphtheriae bv. mitis]OJH99855.1 phosphatase [Corynebacterium diphtheriae]OSQ06177.1 phosphatase [Corynebacterium diphtheriae]CAB0489573.1 phosphatase [Corynebacterium diphtheriae]CAB0534589.1 phosphatase [Corynebacterium diphtheriae]
MRLGVLDVGSNTVHLVAVNASQGGRPRSGALVAEAAMRALNIEQLEICPWALREGVILRRTEQGIVPEETSKGDA